MTGLSTIGIKLSCKATSESSFTDLPNLISVPEIGGEKSKIDVTTLADSQEKFIPGIKSVGDMEFGFLYDANQTASSYKILNKIEKSEKTAAFKLTFPDGTEFTFDGYVSLKTGSAEVDDKLTFTAAIIPNSLISCSLDTTEDTEGQG